MNGTFLHGRFLTTKARFGGIIAYWSIIKRFLNKLIKRQQSRMKSFIHCFNIDP